MAILKYTFVYFLIQTLSNSKSITNLQYVISSQYHTLFAVINLYFPSIVILSP